MGQALLRKHELWDHGRHQRQQAGGREQIHRAGSRQFVAERPPDGGGGHERQVDRLFVVYGSLRLVLYDGREASRTRGKVDVLILSPLRPTQVAIPPGVWHGLQNLEPDTSMFVNMFDHAYRYDDPDEWRLPPDTDAIPWRF